jgi:dTDP-4-dehydrorhamnose reductase
MRLLVTGANRQVGWELSRSLLPVCTENLNSDIVVMKPAEDRA